MSQTLSPPHGRGAPRRVSACVALPAAASAKKQDLKVMTRNVYLGADLIPLAAAPDRASRSSRPRPSASRPSRATTSRRRAKALAAEIKKAKPDVIGVQEATIWRRGADGVKDGSATPATQVIYDSSKELRKALKRAGTPYKRGRRAARGSTSRRRPRSTTTSASPSAT